MSDTDPKELATTKAVEVSPGDVSSVVLQEYSELRQELRLYIGEMTKTFGYLGVIAAAALGTGIPRNETFNLVSAALIPGVLVMMLYVVEVLMLITLLSGYLRSLEQTLRDINGRSIMGWESRLMSHTIHQPFFTRLDDSGDFVISPWLLFFSTLAIWVLLIFAFALRHVQQTISQTVSKSFGPVWGSVSAFSYVVLSLAGFILVGTYAAHFLFKGAGLVQQRVLNLLGMRSRQEIEDALQREQRRCLAFMVPTSLTALRLILGVYVVFCAANRWFGAAALLFTLAMLTDVGDGLCARVLHSQSRFGGVFDAAADGLFFLMVLFAYGSMGLLQHWVVALYILAGLVGFVAQMVRSVKLGAYGGHCADLGKANGRSRLCRSAARVG